MCFAGVGAGISVATSVLTSTSQSIHGKASAARAAKIAKIQASQALQRGEMDAATVGREFSKLVGRQKAVFASQGFDVSVGDPQRITEETLAVGRNEQALVQYNAQLDAWSLMESAPEGVSATDYLSSSVGKTLSKSGVLGIVDGGDLSSRAGNFSSVGRIS